jgi:cell division protein FtsL
MTHNVIHTNKMIFDLKEQYQQNIKYLQSKIQEQEQEIEKLKTMITLLSIERDYDC